MGACAAASGGPDSVTRRRLWARAAQPPAARIRSPGGAYGRVRCSLRRRGLSHLAALTGACAAASGGADSVTQWRPRACAPRPPAARIESPGGAHGRVRRSLRRRGLSRRRRLWARAAQPPAARIESPARQFCAICAKYLVYFQKQMTYAPILCKLRKIRKIGDGAGRKLHPSLRPRRPPHRAGPCRRWRPPRVPTPPAALPWDPPGWRAARGARRPSAPAPPRPRR